MSMVLKWSTRTNCISGNKRIQDKANDDTLLKCFTVLKISPFSKSVRLNLMRTKFHCFGFFFVGKDIQFQIKDLTVVIPILLQCVIFTSVQQQTCGH